MDDTAVATPEAARSRRFPNWTRGSVVGALIAVLGVLIGVASIADNSFLTHLVTGRLILSGTFPHADPYSFTAPGRHWIVYSWLASVLYAAAEHAGHGVGIRALITATTVILALCIWRLTRPARTLMGRVGAVAVPLLIGTVAWGPRPLLFGLLLLALLVIIVEEGRDPRWLVPLMWVWVNIHGSWPLGLVYLLLGIVGARLDRQEIAAHVSALKWAALGTLLGGLSPVGPQILWFPVNLLTKRKSLSGLIEWQAPPFTDLWQQAFLVAVVVTIVLSPRLPPERRYRSMLITAVFTAAALLGSRNVVVASVVLVPIMAAELKDVGSLSAAVRRPVNGVATVVLGALAVLLLVSGLSGPSYNFAGYPVTSISWLDSHHLLGPGHRVAARDFVGNYLEYRYRGKVPVFIDDRLDMFPASMAADSATLISGGRTWSQVLDRHKIDVVVWETALPLSSLLRESPKWRQVEQSGKWAVFQRVGAVPSG